MPETARPAGAPGADDSAAGAADRLPTAGSGCRSARPVVPVVSVVIPVHHPDRRVDRAADSALAQSRRPGAVEVIVVAHGIDPATTRGHERLAQDPAVTYLRCDRDPGSPAAPRNDGAAAARGTWILPLDSDDWLEPGALTAWLAAARAAERALGSAAGPVAAVLPRQVADTGPLRRHPVMRPLACPALPGRSGARLLEHGALLPGGARILDPVADRLLYRPGHLGLIRASVLRRLGLAWREGLGVGEDLFLSYPLWASGLPLVAAPGPAYVVGSDGPGRATGQAAPGTMARELAAVTALLDSDWAAAVELAHPGLRRQLTVKLLRGQVFSAVRNRWDGPAPSPEDRVALAGAAAAAIALDPAARGTLSRSDAALLDLLLDPASPWEAVVAAARRRWRFGRPGTLLTADPRRLLDRDAPLRFMAASALLR